MLCTKDSLDILAQFESDSAPQMREKSMSYNSNRHRQQLTETFYVVVVVDANVGSFVWSFLAIATCFV